MKKAIKSAAKERQLLRAHSAVQRFPVAEWRQHTEDFHKKSINASRKLVGLDAWRSWIEMSAKCGRSSMLEIGIRFRK